MACAGIVADQVPTSRSAGQNYPKTSLTSKTATSPHDCPGREPQKRAGRRADTGCTPDSAANVKARAPPQWAPEPPSSGYPHRSLAPIPVRHASVDTATQRSTARQGDTRRDRAETPRQHENSQLAGRFRSVWQVLGSNQRRLSRRALRDRVQVAVGEQPLQVPGLVLAIPDPAG
jgi:hypothetical protein